jgi:hypothetical protein
MVQAICRAHTRNQRGRLGKEKEKRNKVAL